ncbi:uncharacterized protein EKO05_0004423 [Ascochyta rabiei]|uniref:uncharacterized protein n=1 Tax=Didymella rabiei TaxID=5454 RepID=UPI0021FD91C0|nr:uncharacterized protein EKO05_0004423 [Ascochyta rabiei]UPX13928.1 hypothetical protein EKO05_0004423 [Ascochyta rabiei]
MGSNQESNNEQIVFCDDGGRPQIDVYQDSPNFFPNDYVSIINPPRAGVFRVKESHKNTYKLLDSRGKLLDDGRWFKESDLQLED